MKISSMAGMALGAVLMIVGVLGTPPLSEDAESYASEVATNSAKTYLALRVLNAGISFAEEVEMSGGIGVASGAIQPFKLLEPLDDAVERLSDAVFVIGVIAALFSILMPLVGTAGLLLLGAGILGFSMTAYAGTSKWLPTQLPSFFGGVARSGALLFAALIVFVFGGQLGSALSDRAWAQHTHALVSISEEISSILEEDSAPETFGEALQEKTETEKRDTPHDETAEAGNESSGYLDSITNVFSSAGQMASDTFDGASNVLGSSFDRVKEVTSLIAQASSLVSILLTNADELIASMTIILASFLLELLLVPLGLFLIVVKVERSTRSK